MRIKLEKRADHRDGISNIFDAHDLTHLVNSLDGCYLSSIQASNTMRRSAARWKRSGDDHSVPYLRLERILILSFSYSRSDSDSTAMALRLREVESEC